MTTPERPRSSPVVLRFYFDFISHNAYLGWAALKRIARARAVVVEPVPVLFAGFLEALGQKGPAEVAPKARWMVLDVVRKARELGVPLAPPFAHPFVPLLPLRVTTAVPAVDRHALVDLLFHAIWAESLDATDPRLVVRLANEAGFNGEALLQRAGEASTKSALREATDTAIAGGVFGVPTVVVLSHESDGRPVDSPRDAMGSPALFWGYDDLRYLELFLDGRDPATNEDWARWLAVPRGADRKAAGVVPRRGGG